MEAIARPDETSYIHVWLSITAQVTSQLDTLCDNYSNSYISNRIVLVVHLCYS